MIRADRLDPDRSLVLIIDLQHKLLPAIDGRESVVRGARKLLDGVRVFGVPVLATEQYPKGLGTTDAAIAEALQRDGATVLEKPTFSACGEAPIRSRMAELDREQIIIAGIEAHVCVQQTTLDLVAMDYDVFVCADAVGSRGKVDYDRALARLAHAGAVVTTVESVLFELCGRCDTDRFKAMLEVIKATPPAV